VLGELIMNVNLENYINDFKKNNVFLAQILKKNYD